MHPRVSRVIGPVLVLVLASGSAVGAGTEPDQAPVGADFRISSSIASEYTPAVAWNQTDNQYLVVWADGRRMATRGWEIYGRRVRANGARVGADFLISTSTAHENTPAVVWDQTTNQYLVVWEDERNSATRGKEIYGRRVRADGVPIGADFRISTSTASEHDPAVTWNQTTNQYLVVWEDNRNYATRETEIYGRRVLANGVPVGADFQISTSTDSEDSPAVTWNQTKNQYLVVWRDLRDYGTRGREIYGRRVKANGVPVGAVDFRISNSTADESAPAVVWNRIKNQYLVVWQDERYPARGTEIYGRRVKANGARVRTDFRISNSYANEYAPAVAWNQTANQYLVVWEDGRNSAARGTEIYGRRVKANGARVGADFRISNSTNYELAPAVASNQAANQYLVVWEDDRNHATRGYEIYGRRITGATGP